MLAHDMSFSSDDELQRSPQRREERLDVGSSIEALRLQIVTTRVPQEFEKIKNTLLSIVHILKPKRNEKQRMMFSFVNRVVDLSMNIMLLLEATEVLRPVTIEKLFQVLGGVKTFILSANRWGSYPYSIDVMRKVLSSKSRVFELRITSILEGLERSLCDAQEAPMGGSSNQFCNNASNLFSNASNFTVNNSQFYNVVGGSVHFFPNAEGHPDFPGLPYYEDLELETELHKTRGYRLHRGHACGRAVVVKVFYGPHAKQLCLKTAELHRSVMHPNILHMIGGPNSRSGSSFLVFAGDYQGTVESQLPIVLKEGIKEGCVIGVKTVIACSLGLDYLHESGLPFSVMDPELFVLMISKDGRIVLNFDADATWIHAASIHNPDHPEIDQSDKATNICNELIRKTFYLSCKEHYQDRRIYDDEGGDVDQAFFEIEDGSVQQADETDGYRPGPERDNPQCDSASQTRNAPRNLKGHRRELVWKSQPGTSSSLQEIGQQYQAYLTGLRFEDVLVQRRGYSAKPIAHRCPGYKRTEIVLTQDIKRSGILSHTSPVPNEICFVCGEKVNVEETFDCICGLPEENSDNSRPTIKCIVCFRWQHQKCMGVSPATQMKSFTCCRCPGSSLMIDSLNKKNETNHTMTSEKCHACNTTKSPEWCNGPNGSGTLCNTCGLIYKTKFNQSEVNDKQSRLAGACARCKILKVRCEAKTETEPCKRCFNGGHECVIPGRKIRRTPPKREHLLNQIQSQAKEIERLMYELEKVSVSSSRQPRMLGSVDLSILRSTVLSPSTQGSFFGSPPKREDLLNLIRSQAKEIERLMHELEKVSIPSLRQRRNFGSRDITSLQPPISFLPVRFRTSPVGNGGQDCFEGPHSTAW